eukprot:Gb_30668 [translate_table: standard]
MTRLINEMEEKESMPEWAKGLSNQVTQMDAQKEIIKAKYKVIHKEVFGPKKEKVKNMLERSIQLSEDEHPIKSPKHMLDLVEQEDYDKQAENAMDYEDIKEQHQQSETEAASKKDEALTKDECFYAETAFAGPSSNLRAAILDKDNYDEEEEYDKKAKLIEKHFKVQTEALECQKKRKEEENNAKQARAEKKAMDEIQIQQNEVSRLEQQLEKAEVAQRHQMQVEKAANAIHAEAIKKNLDQDSTRKKQEDKLHKQRDEIMLEKGCDPNVITYNKLIGGLCKVGKVKKSLAQTNELLSNPQKYIASIVSASNAQARGLTEVGLTNKHARNYRIPEVGKLNSMFITGRIIPAIATTAAMATGLVCLELYKFFYCDSLECLPPKALGVENVKPLNNSYNARVSVFRWELQAKLLEAKLFVIGAGAVGYEFLKALALMGASCNGKGGLTIIKFDVVKKSNLTKMRKDHSPYKTSY